MATSSPCGASLLPSIAVPAARRPRLMINYHEFIIELSNEI